jgi:hypothetical protein
LSPKSPDIRLSTPCDDVEPIAKAFKAERTWEEFKAVYICHKHDKSRLDFVYETNIAYIYLIMNFDSEGNMPPDREMFVVDVAIDILGRVAQEEYRCAKLARN